MHFIQNIETKRISKEITERAPSTMARHFTRFIWATKWRAMVKPLNQDDLHCSFGALASGEHFPKENESSHAKNCRVRLKSGRETVVLQFLIFLWPISNVFQICFSSAVRIRLNGKLDSDFFLIRICFNTDAFFFVWNFQFFYFYAFKQAHLYKKLYLIGKENCPNMYLQYKQSKVQNLNVCNWFFSSQSERFHLIFANRFSPNSNSDARNVDFFAFLCKDVIVFIMAKPCLYN